MDPETTGGLGPDRGMVNPFPRPGRRLEHAYRELTIALDGTKEQKKALGNPLLLPRPWDPDTLTHGPLRRELWDWLEDVVAWLNIEYVWDVGAVIPACWPHHPHLVRELAVLADQRRQATRALGSDALEEWHRYALPAFVERMGARVKNHCEDGHQQWPGKGRYARHTGTAARQERQQVFAQDAATARPGAEPPAEQGTTPQPHVVDGVHLDPATGEVFD